MEWIGKYVTRLLANFFLEPIRLRIILREQLIKSGWRDSVRSECRRVVQEQGLDNVSVDEIIKQVTPIARSELGDKPFGRTSTNSHVSILSDTIPNDVKQDLLQRIREIVQQETGP